MAVSWKGILGGIVPTIATALANPGAGALALVGKVSQALLGKPDGTAAEIAAAVPNATPEQIGALQKLEDDFVTELAGTLAAMDKADADDRGNARAREIAVRDHMPAILAIMLSLMVMGCVSLLSFHVVPPENREPFLLLTGSISTCWIGAMTYYHGTSSGSKSKDAVIGKMAAAR